MGKFTNPYKRLEEIKEEIHRLEVKIAGEKGIKQKKEFETELMFLVFEQLPIEDTIRYFERMKKYEEVQKKRKVRDLKEEGSK